MEQATRSNHFVDHAIDVNVVDRNGQWCNSYCLRYTLNQCPHEMLSALLIRSEMIYIFAGEEIFPRQMWSTLMNPLIRDGHLAIAGFTTTYRKTADLNDRGKRLSEI